MLNEVSPPGYGHTKGDKEKGVKKGGTAAAFDRARKEGRFKGSKSDMFAIMWSQKNKGDKPHYKPGTNEKKKKYQDESFDIDSKAHKKVQRQAKIRNLAKGNENPNEKSAAERKLKGPKLVGEEGMTYQEAIDAGWEMSGEGIWMPPQTETVTEKISFPSFKKKVAERKPEKATDAGAKARRAMKRREHAKYVSGSEDNVPDDIRD
jgi:hypothetical protein